jgi:pimeloyl-ACP methyl ester carboxylesterase
VPDNLARETVVFVHGAFADGSSRNKVIANLQKKSIDVVAVQYPLSSLADDVAATDRAIEAAKRPVILVGHSWADAVIAQAGNNPKVEALVYVAAFAPDVGMSVNDLGRGAPPPEWHKSLVVSEDGFVTLPPDSVTKKLAQHLPEPQAAVLAATQGPTAAHVFDEKVSVAAWRGKPNWYIVAKQDRSRREPYGNAVQAGSGSGGHRRRDRQCFLVALARRENRGATIAEHVLGFKSAKNVQAMSVTNTYPGGYWEDQGYD